MSDVIAVSSIEELIPFLNEKGVMEIAVREKNKRFKQFYKIAIDNLKKGEGQEAINQVANVLNSNLGNRAINIMNKVQLLQGFNLVLSGANLCATAMGFAIMYKKLEGISAQVNEVMMLQKSIAGIESNFKFNTVISNHADMLDCRKKQKPYSEEKMRELVDSEYSVLCMMIETLGKGVAENKNELCFSILSLASMLSSSLVFFDEVYYFNNKSEIEVSQIWHLSHDKWVKIFDTLLSTEYIEMMQDIGFFEMQMNVLETDYFYLGYIEQVKELKQDIEDNQILLSKIDDPELFKRILEATKLEVKEELENAVKDAGQSQDVWSKIIQTAVA